MEMFIFQRPVSFFSFIIISNTSSLFIVVKCIIYISNESDKVVRFKPVIDGFNNTMLFV